MSRNKRLDFILQVPSITNVAQDQTLTAAGDLNLNGSLTSSGTLSLPTAQKIDFESAADVSAATLTITGTTELGVGTTETISAPVSNTVTTAKYWKTISQIASSASIGTNMSAGVSDEAKSQTVPMNRYNHTGTTIAIDIGGTINYTVNETFIDVQGTDTVNWIAISALTSKTADLNTTLTNSHEGLQFVVSSYSSGATLSANVLQV